MLSDIGHTQRQMPCDLTSVCNLKTKTNKQNGNRLRHAENRLMVAGRGGDLGGLAARGRGQAAHAGSHRAATGCEVQPREHSRQCCNCAWWQAGTVTS